MPHLLRSLIASLGLCLLGATTAVPAQSGPTVAVRIIGFNDFHGHLESGELMIAVPDPQRPGTAVPLRVGGAAALAATVRQLRAGRPHSIVVSAGDLVGASPLVSGLFLDEPTIEAMNALGLEINAVGNHEFDRGAAELLRLLRGGCRTDLGPGRASCAGPQPFAGARFATISANVVERASGRTLLPASLIREFDGVRIGFVGAVTRTTPGIVTPSGVAGLRFLPEAEALNAEAQRLRGLGIKALVAVIHEGGDADGGFDDCRNPRGTIFDIVRELDAAYRVVLTGHTHRAYRCLIDGRLVIQGASFGRLVSVVDVEVDRASGELVASTIRARNVPVANGLGSTSELHLAFPAPPPDGAVAALVAHYRDRAAPLAAQPIGRLAAPIDRRASGGGDHALGRLIADAQLAATRAEGAQIAFTNPGGIRADLRPGPNGAITYADAFAVQPFGNTLVTLTLTGAQIRSLLDAQWSAPDRARMLQPSRGFSYAWSEDRPAGERVLPETLRLDGRPLDPDGSYRVTVNDFLADGGDAFSVLREGRERRGGVVDLDALVDYLRRNAAPIPLEPDREARIRRRR